jgi:hypothetical protein
MPGFRKFNLLYHENWLLARSRDETLFFGGASDLEGKLGIY